MTQRIIQLARNEAAVERDGAINAPYAAHILRLRPYAASKFSYSEMLLAILYAHSLVKADPPVYCNGCGLVFIHAMRS